MSPAEFPEANQVFGPPQGMDVNQVMPIKAFVGQILGGSCDGMQMVVVAWRPEPEDLVALNDGALVYLAVIGGLPPHAVTTTFPTRIG